ncbi:hypothetical protein DSO57_1026957 [Entomophthora muscae]|uniref:Uncharacterized protein n=1 Tax=Entomophthora muscae TaxID=34485 RepID=A0ACC2TD83_9FUNG|nr:hypothetical protein DSO57_1026957 [Entomophthora muscae]
MTEKISPKPSQIQSHIGLDDLDSMSDFSDGELYAIASKVPITPKINKNVSQNEPMETQSQATQNHFGLSVKIQDKKIKLSSKPKESQVASTSSTSLPLREVNKINPGNVMPDDYEALNRLYYMYLYPYRLFFK